MTIRTDVRLGAAFGAPKSGREAAAEVPEEIRRHAAAPILRPGGEWAAMADEVDRRVREEQAALKAKMEAAERSRRRGRGSGMGM